MTTSKLVLWSTKTFFWTLFKFTFFGILITLIFCILLLTRTIKDYNFIWIYLFIVILFSIIFPIIYFIFGKKQALQKIIYQAISWKDTVVEDLINKTVDKLIESKEKIESKALVKSLKSEHRLVNKISWFLVKKFIDEEILNAVETLKNADKNISEEIKTQIKEKLIENINDRFKPSNLIFRIIFWIETAIFVLCWIFIF